MPVKPILEVKSKFQTGDIPVQSDFEDLIDTLSAFPTVSEMPTLSTVATTGSYNDLIDVPVSSGTPLPYTAVVAIDGTGDYTDVYSAWDDGHRRIGFKEGVYQLDTPLVVATAQDNDTRNIDGPHFYGLGGRVKLIANTTNELFVTGDTYVGVYSNNYGGTVSCDGSNILTDTGTTFLSSGIVPGHMVYFDTGFHVLLYGPYYVKSVDSDTQITLESDVGSVISGLTPRFERQFYAEFKNLTFEILQGDLFYTCSSFLRFKAEKFILKLKDGSTTFNTSSTRTTAQDLKDCALDDWTVGGFWGGKLTRCKVNNNLLSMGYGVIAENCDLNGITGPNADTCSFVLISCYLTMVPQQIGARISMLGCKLKGEPYTNILDT